MTTTGRVTGIRGTILEATLPCAGLGHRCVIKRQNGSSLNAEIISLKGNSALLAPVEDPFDVLPGDPVQSTGAGPQIAVPEKLLGIVLDGSGNILSEHSDPCSRQRTIPVYQAPPPALERLPVTTILPTGISAVDCFCPLGQGQRLGIMASAGSGKSTLLAMLARNTPCDISVIALIGERGREVGEFLESLGNEGRAKSVVVVSTSDETPLKRILAANTATAIAESYRTEGKSVLLLFDSLTRYARAVRDLGLSSGEIPVRQGYPSSVYAKLPQLLERAGNDASGSMTAVYTLLGATDEGEDPLTDEIKSLLDGHLVLSSSLAELGRRPSIDISRSISRLNTRLYPQDLLYAQQVLRRAIHRLQHEKSVIAFGGIPDAEMKRFLEYEPLLEALLSQQTRENRHLKVSLQKMLEIYHKLQ